MNKLIKEFSFSLIHIAQNYKLASKGFELVSIFRVQASMRLQ